MTLNGLNWGGEKTNTSVIPAVIDVMVETRRMRHEKRETERMNDKPCGMIRGARPSYRPVFNIIFFLSIILHDKISLSIK